MGGGPLSGLVEAAAHARDSGAPQPSPDQAGFLRALDAMGKVARTNRDLRRVVDRDEDRIRQACRRNGWVEYAEVDGKRGWILTTAGVRCRAAIDAG